MSGGIPYICMSVANTNANVIEKAIITSNNNLYTWDAQ